MYNFNDLYQQWVTDVKTNVPSTPDDRLTTEEFLSQVQSTIQDCWDCGDPVPEDYQWIFDTQFPPR